MEDMLYSAEVEQYVLLEAKVSLGYTGRPTLKYNMVGKGYSSYGHAKGARTQRNKPDLLIAKVKFDKFVNW